MRQGGDGAWILDFLKKSYELRVPSSELKAQKVKTKRRNVDKMDWRVRMVKKEMG